MAKRKPRIQQANIVQRFAVRLRELREDRKLTRVELANQASVALSHLSRLESGEASPGLDLLERLAKSLAIPLTQLLPPEESAETVDQLREQAKKMLDKANRETLVNLNPLLARLT